MTFPNPEYLTHPNIPKPLHGVNPRSIKGKEWWDGKRRIAYSTYDYRCWACGVRKWDADYHQWLEAHESYDINYSTGEVKLIEIIALCHSCHNFIHSGRMMVLLQKGEMEREKVYDIVLRGRYILHKNNLKPYWVTDYLWLILNDREDEFVLPEDANEDNDASWSEWHLVLDGEKHYSPYKNIEEWKEAYR